MPERGEYITVAANGLAFEVFAAGDGDRLALCLHGFPEHAVAWQHQIPLLVELGYRVWAPNLRGYGRTSRPPRVADYDIACLLDDVAGLIDASGATSVTLIGHDWGAVVAWFFAMRRTRALERLVIINVPHPAIFAARLRDSWAQRRRSWYVLLFALPGLAEALLGYRDAFPVEAMFVRTACAPERFAVNELAIYRAQANEPGALTAMLNWYRAALRGGAAAQFRLGFPRIDVPTLVIWGEEDVALGKETTYGTHRYVDDLRVQYLPGVSHWAAQEAPERVNALLTRFLRAT